MGTSIWTREDDMHLFTLGAILAYNDGSQWAMHIVMGMLVGLGVLVAIAVAVFVWQEHEREGTPSNDKPTRSA
jgi:hypothetical protein